MDLDLIPEAWTQPPEADVRAGAMAGAGLAPPSLDAPPRPSPVPVPPPPVVAKPPPPPVAAPPAAPVDTLPISAPAPAPPDLSAKLPPKTIIAHQRIPTREELQAHADRAQLDADTITANAAATKAARDHAQVDADAAAEHARVVAERQKANVEALKKYDDDVAWAKTQADAESARHKQMLQDFDNPRNGFWARSTTPQKIQGGVALLLGIFGGAKDGSNVGAERIAQAIAEDRADRRQRIMDQLEIVSRSRADVRDTVASLSTRLHMVDLSTADALDAAAAQAEAKAKRLGIADADIAGNQGLLKLRDQALKIREAWAKDVAPTVKDDWRTKKSGGGGGGGRGADAAAILTEMIESGKNGEPYPTAELQRKAAELRFPLTGKAGTLSLDSLLKTTTFRQKGADVHHRSDERDAALEVTDAEGNVRGKAKNTVEARQLNKSEAAFAQLKERTQALIDDIKRTGPRVLDTKEMQRRESLAASVAAAGRVYNGLGATDASQALEQKIVGAMGTPGHGWFMGANLDVVKHTLDEAEKQHTARLNIGLRAGTQKPAPAAAPQGRRVRLKDGRVGTLTADGTFHEGA